MKTRARLFDPLNLLYGCLGISSLVAIGIGSITYPLVASASLIYSSVVSVSTLILNFHGLRRIRDGVAGEFDLVFIWAGLFAAALSSMFWGMMILYLAIH